MTTEGVSERLAALTGKTIVSIRRLHYVYKGRIDFESGGIELVFSNGSAALFGVGPDGEALGLREAVWRDPFEEPLSTENREFIEKSGKWTAFDVSKEPQYAPLVGRAVLEVQRVVMPGGKITGAAISTSAGTVRVIIGADEVLVTVS